MRKPFIRETVGAPTRTAAGRRLHTWNDLLASFPGLIGVKTGHTDGAGWSQVAAARGGGVTIYATMLGSATREERNADLAELLAWGLSRYRTVWAIDGDRVYATARTAYGREPVRLVAAKPALRVIRVDRPLVERVVAPAAVALPVRKGQRARRGAGLDRGTVLARSPLVAARRGRAAGRRRTRRLLRGPHARPSRGTRSRDRHRHAERRARPHADRPELPARPAPPREPGAHARGRQGDQRRARAQAPRRPGRRDRARRRAHRARASSRS